MNHSKRFMQLFLVVLVGLGLLVGCSNNPVGPKPTSQFEQLNFQPDVEAIPVTSGDIGLARKVGLSANGRYIRARYGGFLAAPGAFVRIPANGLQEDTYLSFRLELRDSEELERENITRPDGSVPSGAITFTLYTADQQPFHIDFPDGVSAQLYLNKFWLTQLGINPNDLKLVHVWEDENGVTHRETVEFTEYYHWLVANAIPGFSVWAWTW